MAQYRRPFYDRRNDQHLNRAAIKPCLWGGQLWDSLHYMTLGYPVENPSPEIRDSARELMWSLQWLLPCVLCREHLAEIYRTTMPLTPEVFTGRKAWGEYIVRMRDYIKKTHAGGRSRAHTFEHDVTARLLDRTCGNSRALQWGGIALLSVFLVMLFRS